MGLRSKSRWRITILVSAVVGVTVLGGAGYMALRAHRNKQLDELKVRGLEAYQKGEWVDALNMLGPYVSQRQDDAEAIDAFVNVRLKLPEPDMAHVLQARRQYQRLVALRPGELKYKLALNELYTAMNLNTELLQGTDDALRQLAGDLTNGQPEALPELQTRLVTSGAAGTAPSTGRGDDADAAASKTAELIKAQLARHAAAGEKPEEIKKKFVDPLVQTLELKRTALGRLRRWDDGKVMASLAYQLDPSAATISLDLEIRQTDNASAEALEGRLLKLAKGLEKDAPTQLLLAQYYGVHMQNEKAAAAAKAALECEHKSDLEIVDLMKVLESLDMFPESRQALAEGRKKFPSDVLEVEYYRRLIFDQKYDEVASGLSKEDLTKRPELAGLRALALCELGTKMKAAGQLEAGEKKLEEARPILEVLKACGDRWDYKARDWESVLNIKYFAKAAADRDIIQACNNGVQRQPDNAMFHHFLANAYAASGDSASAMDEWDRAWHLAPAWDEPLARESLAYSSTGNFGRGYVLANLAVRRRPEDAKNLEAKVVAWRGALGAPELGGPDGLLKFLSDHRAQLGMNDTAVGLEVALLVDLKRREQAEARVRELLAAATPATARVVLTAAIVVHDKDLPAALQKECQERYMQLKGMTPDLAALQCRFLLQAALADQGRGIQARYDMKAATAKGDVAEAKRLEEIAKAAEDAAASKRLQAKSEFESMKGQFAAKSGGDTDAWEVNWCVLLETVKDPGAHDAWAKLIKEHSGNSQALWAALAANSVRGDHLLVGTALDWLAHNGGETGISWRIERGQWMLEDHSTEDATEKALKFAQLTVNMWPQSIPARKLLVRCYRVLNNTPNAIAELNVAADKAPLDVDLKLDLAQLYLQQRDGVRAAEQLRRVGAMGQVNQTQRVRAGILSEQAGETDLAIAMLAEGKDEAALELLPGLYWKRGDLPKALEGFKRAVTSSKNPRVIEMALSFFAVTDRPADAEEALKALDKLEVDASLKHGIKGSYLAMTRDTEGAIAELNLGAKANPKNEQIWRRLIGTQLLAGKVADAAKSSEGAAAAMPDDVARKTIASLGAASAREDDVRDYLSQCILFPQQSRGVDEAMKVLQAIQNDPPRLAEQVALVASRNPSAMSLQVLAIRKAMAANRRSEAVQMAQRALLMDPTAVEPAALLTVALAQQGRWEDSLSAARAWKAISRGAIDPDLMIATTYLRLLRPADALKVIQQYENSNISNDQAARSVMLLLSAALVQSGQIETAESRLWPIVEKNPAWRDDWLKLATDSMPADHRSDAERWIRKLTDVTQPADVDGQMLIAQAWYRMSGKYSDNKAAANEMLKTANAIVALKLTDPEQLQLQANADVMLGTMREKLGDKESAEGFYRAALKIKPQFFAALNNLAVVLAREAEDDLKSGNSARAQSRLNEAMQNVQAAIATTPTLATLYDSMALVQRVQGKTDEALGSLEKARRLEPENPEWLISVAETQLKASRQDDARKTLEQIVSMDINFRTLTDPRKRANEEFVALKDRYDTVRRALATPLP